MRDNEIYESVLKDPKTIKQLAIARLEDKALYDTSPYLKKDANRWLIDSIATGLVEHKLVNIKEIPQDDGTIKLEARLWCVDVNSILKEEND